MGQIFQSVSYEETVNGGSGECTCLVLLQCNWRVECFAGLCPVSINTYYTQDCWTGAVGSVFEAALKMTCVRFGDLSTSTIYSCLPPLPRPLGRYILGMHPPGLLSIPKQHLSLWKYMVARLSNLRLERVSDDDPELRTASSLDHTPEPSTQSGMLVKPTILPWRLVS